MPIKTTISQAGNLLWTMAGALSVGIGALGVILPVLPTTPFIILAAFCFARGSPRLARALEHHRLFGPIIADWRRYGAIAPRYKLMAHVMMVATICVSAVIGVPPIVLLIQALCMAVASLFILSRPSSSVPIETTGPGSAQTQAEPSGGQS